MEQKHFKKQGDRLGFNTLNADLIFVIVHENDYGYMYFQETKPFGPLNFVPKHLVNDLDQKAKDAEAKVKAEKKKTRGLDKSPGREEK